MRPFTFLSLLAVAACHRSGTEGPVPSWTLREDLHIGGGDTGAASFTSIAGVATDAAGRIWVLERRAKEIRVFDRSGQWVKTVGRPGAGPGEFGEVNGLRIGPTGIVWVSDYGLKRFVAFDTAGRLLGVHADAIQYGAYQWRGGLDTAGRVFDRFTVIQDTTRRSTILLFRDSSLTTADTLPIGECRSLPGAYIAIPIPRGTMFFDAPDAPQASSSVSSRLVAWCTDGATPRAVGVDLRTGDTVGTIDYARPPLPIDVTERDSAVARLSKQARDAGAPPPDFSHLPDHRPAILALFIDPEERIWLQVPDSVGSRFDLFDRHGKRLAEAATPFKLNPLIQPEVRGDTLLAVAIGEDDVPLVVRLHLSRASR